MLLCSLGMTGGCSLLLDTHQVAYLAKRTIEWEPRLFSYVHNERAAQRRDTRAAKEAWREVTAGNATPFSADYEQGFVDGFADYLHRGGTGEPPVVPPRDYWRLDYQSVAGKQAIDDWFQGFRHGSHQCRARGLRDLVVVPSSLLYPAMTLPYEHAIAAEEAPEEIDSPENLPPLERAFER